MKHAKIFRELANRADPNVSILDAAMEQISILKAAIERREVMSQQCKCEHWEQCPVCMPHRFNDDGELLPVPLTPLQQAREDVAGLRMALAQAETMIERMQCQIDRAVILLRDIAAEPCDYDMEKQPAIYCANKFLAELNGKEWPTLEAPNAELTGVGAQTPATKRDD